MHQECFSQNKVINDICKLSIVCIVVIFENLSCHFWDGHMDHCSSMGEVYFGCLSLLTVEVCLNKQLISQISLDVEFVFTTKLVMISKQR